MTCRMHCVIVVTIKCLTWKQNKCGQHSLQAGQKRKKHEGTTAVIKGICAYVRASGYALKAHGEPVLR